MTPFVWVAVAVVSVVSSARITRLVTWDSFPPSIWVRRTWDSVTREGSWSLLMSCPWCLSFWIHGIVVLSGYYSDWHLVWWLVNGIFGGSYIAAMIVVRDGDDD